jgi:hypothetical protein
MSAITILTPGLRAAAVSWQRTSRALVVSISAGIGMTTSQELPTVYAAMVRLLPEAPEPQSGEEESARYLRLARQPRSPIVYPQSRISEAYRLTLISSLL